MQKRGLIAQLRAWNMQVEQLLHIRRPHHTRDWSYTLQELPD